VAEENQQPTEKKVCEKCGLIHETPLPPGEGKGDEWKIAALSIAGIGMIALIWIWVFKWGVPLVKKLSG
jgi:hypothetical protein